MNIFRQITANNIIIQEYDFLKELAMEAYLLENEDILKLDNENFNEVRTLDAEVRLNNARDDGDGRIDILAQYGDDYLGIIELKLEEVNEDTLSQLEGYLAEREQLISKGFWGAKDSQPKWVGVVVGTSISPDLQKKLQAGYTTPDGIPVAGMVLRRFRSENNEIFVISDTFFNYKPDSRDLSKFEFRGKIYNKSRLVNAVVKSLVEKHPEITLAELKLRLPKHLQGSYGVFTTKELALEIHATTGINRHYIKPDEFIQLADGAIATCNQWSTNNIKEFIQHIEKKYKDLVIKKI